MGGGSFQRQTTDRPPRCVLSNWLQALFEPSRGWVRCSYQSNDSINVVMAHITLLLQLIPYRPMLEWDVHKQATLDGLVVSRRVTPQATPVAKLHRPKPVPPSPTVNKAFKKSIHRLRCRFQSSVPQKYQAANLECAFPVSRSMGKDRGRGGRKNQQGDGWGGGLSVFGSSKISSYQPQVRPLLSWSRVGGGEEREDSTRYGRKDKQGDGEEERETPTSMSHIQWAKITSTDPIKILSTKVQIRRSTKFLNGTPRRDRIPARFQRTYYLIKWQNGFWRHQRTLFSSDHHFFDT